MADVNAFIETLGKDVSAAVVPKVETLAAEISTKTFNVYGPRVSAFASELVKDILEEQSGAFREFVAGLIQDVFTRYHPELAGELHTRVVQGGLELTGRGIRLDVKNRQTGAPVSSLDIPVSLTIKVDPMGVTLQNGIISLDVVR
jgi:hypothetical protein